MTTRPAAPRAATLLAPLLALLGAALPAAAQDVGTTPENSPYRDIPFRQELTFFGGYYQAGKDPAGVAPRSGPLAGARYEIRIAGPAQFFARAGVVRSERTVLNPRVGPATRDLGDQTVNLVLADVGISLNVTGQRTWHGIVPVVAGGLGIASDFESVDVGGFRLGTPFAITFGGGVRVVPGGNWQARVDVTDHLYQVKYPAIYFQPPGAGIEPVLPADASQSVWKHNIALTLGVSYLFFR